MCYIHPLLKLGENKDCYVKPPKLKNILFLAVMLGLGTLHGDKKYFYEGFSFALYSRP